MIIPRYFFNFLVLSFAFTVTTAAEAGFGDDGISCISKNQWVDAKWDLWDSNTSGFKTWVKAKSRFLRKDKMSVQFMVFNTELTYNSGRKVKGRWGTKSPFTNYCLGGCGPNCDASIFVRTRKSRKNSLMQVASKDCLEHDMCMIFHGENKRMADRHCSDEWLDSVDNHVTSARHGNSPRTPQYDNIDFNRYTQCAVKWGS